jgi:phosphatidylinositol-3-phosphatase
MRRRHRVVLAAAAVGAVVTVVAGQVAPAAATSSTSATPPASAVARLEGVPRFGHVFLIIGENTTYSRLDATRAPYLMSTLRPASAWLSNYYAATHWSQANYVALTAGSFTPCDQKDGGASCHRDVDSLFGQLDDAGLGWKVWLESGTFKCDTSSGSSCSSNEPCPLTGFYTTGNPPILFDDIEGPNGVWSPTTPSRECLANDVPAGTPTRPMATFDAALRTGSVGAFNMVIPNGCEDGEANCKPVNDRIRQFDDFLAREVPKIEASPAFGDDGLIIVTYDEDQRAGGLAPKNGLGAGGHVVCALVSPLLVPGTYDQAAYHYSVLRTLEDGFGISEHLGAASAVPALTGMWSP